MVWDGPEPTLRSARPARRASSKNSWLIDDSATKGVNITHHTPAYRDDVNPVLKPTEVWESADLRAAPRTFFGSLWA